MTHGNDRRATKLEELYEEFTKLSHETDVLRSRVDAAVTGILSK